MMTAHNVYWYHLTQHTDPYREGYIGVTSNLKFRHYQHSKGVKGCGKILHQAFQKYGETQIIKTVLHTVSKEEAYLLENQYRPVQWTGWNIAIGGGLPPDTTGRIDSPEVRQRRADSVRKAKAGRSYPSKFKGTSGRYTVEQRALLGSYHKGKTISEAHRLASSEKLSGENSRNAKEINLVHRDNPDQVFNFPCVKTAAEKLGITYNTLRSQAQRVFKSGLTSETNRQGWICLAPCDLENVSKAVEKTLQNRSNRFRFMPKSAGKTHSKAKSVQIESTSGEVRNFDTLLSAAAFIGIDESNLRRYIGLTKKHQKDSNYINSSWKVLYSQVVE